MTDTLRDLLHEAVSEADMPDISDLAWEAGGRQRRRRAASAVGGVAAVALVVGGVAWAVDQRDGHRSAGPVQSPTATSAPYSPADKPDGTYHGTSVWFWSNVMKQSPSRCDPPGSG